VYSPEENQWVIFYLWRCCNIISMEFLMGFNLLDLLLPRETKFYDYMNQHIDFLVEGATTFQDLMSQLETLPEAERKSRCASIKRCESDMDKLEAKIIEELQTTFITPIDREDIHALAIQVDRAMDMINGIARKIEVYGIQQVPSNAKRFADIIVTMSRGLRETLHLLQSHKEVKDSCERLHKLENECDELFNISLGELFKNATNPLDVIKFKEIYEILEACSDTIDYSGKLIRGIRVKQG